jgi:TIR domain
MKVFLSWSGKRSQLLANTLREWLPLVLHYLEPWVSQADIVSGQPWAVTLAQELEASDFGILCLTRENMGSPWVLFEAGSLAKSLDHGKVVPFLLDLDLSDIISSPLGQFQAKKVDRTDTAALVRDINWICADPIGSARLTQLFDALWPPFDAQLQKILEMPNEPGPARAPGEILEDLVVTVRSIDQRMRGLEDAYANRPSARR